MNIHTDSELPLPSKDQVETDDLPIFEPEGDAENFSYQSTGSSVSGTFVVLESSVPVATSEVDADWDIDFSSAQISGEGISTDAAVAPDTRSDDEFLKVRNRGRKSRKRAVVPSGTRLFIDPQRCQTWATEIIEKEYYCSDDIDALISFCEGNGNANELRFNVQRALEVADFELFDVVDGSEGGLWSTRSEVPENDLVEALEAALSRDTHLPGIRRFNMDKSNEARLLAPMVRAKQELQLGILACAPAVETILKVIDKLLDGSMEPGLVTMRAISPSQTGHAETIAFFTAGEALKTWSANGHVMDGRRRRGALEALDSLELSLMFHKAMVKAMVERQPYREEALHLDDLISVFETTIEQLILEHLSYTRRFAARNVEAGEDPEDVFQVAFLGLQRSTRRFDPGCGHRFVIYATFWMKQALARWRADEGGLVRVPMHRHEGLSKFEREAEVLETRLGRHPINSEIDEALGWPKGRAKLFMSIPRLPVRLDEIENQIGLQSYFEGSHSEMQKVQEQNELKAKIYQLLARLIPREERILRLRFGLGVEREYTLEEVGQMFNLTRERIRQIEARALRKLQKSSHVRRMKFYWSDN